MPKVNPDILKWARETAGLSLEEASSRISLGEAYGVPGAKRLEGLERGEQEPTRALITRMAKQYRRPLLTFYLRHPPREADRGTDFRSLPQDRSDRDEALVDALIRQVRVQQSIARTTLEQEDEVEPLPFVGSVRQRMGVATVVRKMTEDLSFSREEYRAERNVKDAFRLLREWVEDVGVFVMLVTDLGSYHTAIDEEEFRGFAIADPIAPLVVVNKQDTPYSWAFTLLHELCHVWLGQTGVSGGTPDQSVERFCNDVASEILLPQAELRDLSFPVDSASVYDLEQAIFEAARERKVSAGMIAYKLFRAGRVSRERWSELRIRSRERWRSERDERRAEARQTETSGPTYYITRRHLLGNALLGLADRMMRSGALDTAQAGTLLGVNPRSVGPLLADRPRQ